jgi:hypothetical protein
VQQRDRPETESHGERETHAERLDRELDQLLGELRVALPGVQVLFAFLLTVPFSARFPELATGAQDVYFAAVTLVAAASVLLMAPTVHHRLRFRQHTKEAMIRTANRLAIAGMICLALGLGAAVYVAGEAAFPGTWLKWVGAGLVGVSLVVWFVVPFTFRSEQPSTGP